MWCFTVWLDPHLTHSTLTAEQKNHSEDHHWLVCVFDRELPVSQSCVSICVNAHFSYTLYSYECVTIIQCLIQYSNTAMKGLALLLCVCVCFSSLEFYCNSTMYINIECLITNTAELDVLTVKI